MHATDLGPGLLLPLEQLVRVVRRLSSSGDLQPAAAAVLYRLVSDGPHRLTDLAAGERASQPGMTQLVSRLERDGLVRRRSTPTDARVVLVEVTDAGRELAARRREERVAALSALLDQLEPAERAALDAAVPALTRLAQLSSHSSGGSS